MGSWWHRSSACLTVIMSEPAADSVCVHRVVRGMERPSRMFCVQMVRGEDVLNYV